MYDFDENNDTPHADAAPWLSYFARPPSHPPDRPNSSQPEPLFRVAAVHVSVHHLRIALAHTRHPIFNALVLRPLAGPAARAAAAWVLQAQIRAALEGIARFGGQVRAKALALSQRGRAFSEGGRGDGAEGCVSGGVTEAWLAALMDEAGLSVSVSEGGDGADDRDGAAASGEGEEGDGEEPFVETHTRVTAQGVVRTTVMQDSPGTEPEESVLAVGVGPQVLPGKGALCAAAFCGGAFAFGPAGKRLQFTG